MKILERLESKYGHHAISNLTQYLIAGQVVSFILSYSNQELSQVFTITGNQVMGGEWWRLFTYLLAPLSLSPLWAAFTWYLYYMYGSALENTWGSFRYNVYFVISYLATIFAVFLFPDDRLSNAFIYGSVFFAFAYMYPNFTLVIFFILPIKIKWLALMGWIGVMISLISGSMAAKVITVLSLSNFLIFFGREIYESIFDMTQSVTKKSRIGSSGETAFMICAICKATEKNRKIFYYCHTCIPEICYCEDHIKNHTHKKIN